MKIPTDFLKKLASICEEFHIPQWLDVNYCSPLHIATDNGNLQLFNRILEKAEYKNNKDYTPFYTTAGNCSLKFVNLL